MKEGWEYKKLGEVCERITDGSHNPPKGISSSEYMMISSQNVFNDSINLDDVRYLSKDDFLKEDKRTLIKTNDVLLTIVGTIGRCAVVSEGIRNFTLQRSVAVLSPSRIIEPRYLMFCCIGNNDNLNKNAHGVAQRGIYLRQLAKLEIPVPSLHIQMQIVSELDLLSGVIKKQKAQLEELDKLAQSIFYDIFGDPATNEKGWEKTLLGKACVHITDGDHMPPPKSECGIPFITISDIDKVNREIIFDDTFFVPQDYFDSLKEDRKAIIGDVLYTVTGSYGIPVIINTDKQFCFQRHIALLRPNQEMLNTSFLCYWVLCDSVKKMADEVATGIAQKTVGLSSLRKFQIILPPLYLQQEFASKIEAIESMKAKVRQSLKEAETLFNSRMDYYFN